MTAQVRVLGGFEVTVDEVRVPPDAWTRRHAAALVKLLALSRDRRLHREQVVEALWPGLGPEAAGPRLHKAAHYARRALGDAHDAVLLRHDTVALLPGQEVRVDAEEFLRAGAEALAAGTPDAAGAVLEGYGGPLLPDDVYEPWTEESREAVRVLHLDLLRQACRWDDVLREEPADEEAHLALARRSAERGDTREALRMLERLDLALRRELGTGPSREAEELRARLAEPAPAARPGTRLFGRRHVGDQVRERLERAEAGRGGTVVVSGPPGVGKTAVLDLVQALAARRGWRAARGTASVVEGGWPYSPVLEALADLCRRHPALLDGLADVYREELDRALSGLDLTWSGESGHQRLFIAAAELVRLAAAGHGLLLAVDDLHAADEASLRLLHYLSRCALTEPVLLVLTHREPASPALQALADSLAAQGIGTRLELTPLPRSVTRRLLADRFPELSDEDAEQVWAAGAGLPFAVLELARAKVSGSTPSVLPVLPPAVLRTFQRVALLGRLFSTDELLAVSGSDEQDTYRHLEVALAGMLVEPCARGYCFRHELVRESLLAQMPSYVESTARREVADQLAVLGAPPVRVAHQYLAAGLPSRAVPFAIRAVENAGALGAYRDALNLVDAVRDHAGPDDLAWLLSRRGDLLLALGDPGAVPAYREAIAVTTGTEHRLARARLARAAGFGGDLDTARAALAGLGLEDDEADAPILLARANVAWFSGDSDTAWSVASEARERLRAPDDPWHLMDVVGVQGLVAHQRGEWFERFRLELRRTQGQPQLVTALFDAHLCVAEYLLYGPEPYAEIITETEELRRRAAQAGALRGVAFATALIGEAALLSGDLDRAEAELLEAVELHRDVDASAGEAHSLQRLAEVRLAQGDAAEARRLLQRALPLARWSVISMHLMQRVYGTMIVAAPDLVAARAVVDRADATMGDNDHCTFCAVMLAVPASIACADVGDLDGARRHLAVAEASVARWDGTSWVSAVLEARAHLARAEDRLGEYVALLERAADGFAAVGHLRDAQRCAEDATAAQRLLVRTPH